MPAESIAFEYRSVEVTHDPDRRVLSIYSPECPVEPPDAPCFVETVSSRATCCYYLETQMLNGTVLVMCACLVPSRARTFEVVDIVVEQEARP